jgi:hypothetical protein
MIVIIITGSTLDIYYVQALFKYFACVDTINSYNNCEIDTMIFHIL